MEHSNTNKPTTKQQICGSNNIPLSTETIVDACVTSKTSQNQTQQSYNSRQPTPYERRNNWILTGIFVVNFIYACFAGFQWYIMKSSRQLDLRAWVGITEVTGEVIVGKPLVIVVGIKNTGRSPAKYTTSAAIVDIINSTDIPDYTKEQRILERYKEYKGTLSPNQVCKLTIKVNNGIPTNIADFLSIANGKKVLYIYGIYKYEDIFGIPHWITFCYFLNTDGKTYTTYKDHNEIDNN